MPGAQTVFQIVVITLAAAAIVAIVWHYNRCVAEGFEDAALPARVDWADSGGRRASDASGVDVVVPQNERAEHTAMAQTPEPTARMQAEMRPADLLPHNMGGEAAQFGDLHPKGAGDAAGVNFLEAGNQIGLMREPTRNPNLQPRPDPQIPKRNVSPWLMSTIDRDDRIGAGFGTV